MNDDALRRLLRNSLLGRKAPAGLWERVSDRLAGHPRRPLALTLAALALVMGAAALKLSLRPAAEPAPVAVEAPLPSWITAAVEQHRGLSDVFTKTPPLAPRELAELVQQQSDQVVDLPGLRDAGFEPREVHRCLEAGFSHVVYANTWSKLSCFLFEEDKAPLGDEGRPVEAGRLFTVGDASVVAVKDGPYMKLWVADLRPSQLSTIALDAQHKRERIKTTDLTAVKGTAPRAIETLLLGLPGVEDVRVDPTKICVDFDGAQTSEDQIRALAAWNGVADWGSDGR